MQRAPGGSSSGGGGGGGEVSRGGGLGRFCSAPASWLEALLEEEEEDPLKPTQCLTDLLVENPAVPALRLGFGSTAVDRASYESSAAEGGLISRQSSSPAEFLGRQSSSPAEFLGSSNDGPEGYFSGFGIPAHLDYVSLSPNSPSSPNKRLREAEMSSHVKLEEGGFEDAVACRVRAKRGCATHPRSIAERVRRTRISDRIRKLQELVPNMDKQTNTADMLDEAVEYVKLLQKQIQELSEHQHSCKCIPKE